MQAVVLEIFIRSARRISQRACSTRAPQAQTRSHGHLSSPQPQPRQTNIKDLLVTPDEHGMRLDRFLRNKLAQDPQLPPINNNTILRWLEKREVKLVGNDAQLSKQDHSDGTKPLSGKVAKVVGKLKTRTESGQIWRMYVPIGPKEALSYSGTNSHPQPTKSPSINYLPLKKWIVYEDERIVVLNKPSGVAVQGGTGVMASIDNSLELLQGNFPEKPRLVHRLDKTTSGILILARTRKAAQDLTSRFHLGTIASIDANASISPLIRKKYIAIVSSPESIMKTAQMNGSLVSGEFFRLEGDMLMVTDDKTQTIMMAPNGTTNTLLKPTSVWPSVTDVVIASQSYHSKTYWALLYLYPKTGRKHQLRIHCANLLNAPILGDSKYSKTKAKGGYNGAPRIYLHMGEIELKYWVAGNSNVEEAAPEGKNFRFTKDGSLIITVQMDDNMQDIIQHLGL
ncbi:hypothetical protein FBU30_009728 [Linnemannia zychae]|nr:hypothetical protein FBU30_009728 [Linnemannia zychae]